MTTRRKIPEAVQAEVLIAGRRRCCMCFSLGADSSLKKGQIAHIDRDRDNHSPDNLVFLCLLHHDEFDSRTSQSKNFTRREIEHYRLELSTYVARTLGGSLSEQAESGGAVVKETLWNRLVARSLDQDHPWSKFGALAEPQRDDLSSHGHWRLRHSFVVPCQIRALVFAGKDLLASSPGGRTHKYIHAENHLSIDMHVDDERRVRPMAAWNNTNIYVRDDGVLSVVEISFKNDDFVVGDPEIFQAHKKEITYVFFDQNKDRLVSCDESGEVAVWQWPSRKLEIRLQSLFSPLVDASFEFDGDHLVACDANGNFEVFDLRTGRSVDIGKANIRGQGCSVGLVAGGEYLIAADGADRREVLDAKTHDIVDREIWDGLVLFGSPSKDQNSYIVRPAGNSCWVFRRGSSGGEFLSLDLFPPYEKRASSMVISDDGSLLAVVIERRELRIWERVSEPG